MVTNTFNLVWIRKKDFEFLLLPKDEKRVLHTPSFFPSQTKSSRQYAYSSTDRGQRIIFLGWKMQHNDFGHHLKVIELEIKYRSQEKWSMEKGFQAQKSVFSSSAPLVIYAPTVRKLHLQQMTGVSVKFCMFTCCLYMDLTSSKSIFSSSACSAFSPYIWSTALWRCSSS